jgi:hypothetical protein
MSHMSEQHQEITDALVTAYMHLTGHATQDQNKSDAAHQIAHAYLLLTGMDMEQEISCA